MSTNGIDNAVGSAPALNTMKDKLTIVRMLNVIDESDGGPIFPLSVNPFPGFADPTLVLAIKRFQTVNQAQLGGRQPDGRVDPDGPTLKLMKALYRIRAGSLEGPELKLAAPPQVFVVDAGALIASDEVVTADWKKLTEKPPDGLLLIQAISVANMVNQILTRLDGESGRPAVMASLMIVGHGRAGVQVVGSGREIVLGKALALREKTEPKGELLDVDQIRRLKGHFTKNAVVTLTGCNVGAGERGEALLKKLSEAMGAVPVQAGKFAQIPGPGLNGPVVRCSPSACSEVQATTVADFADDLLRALLHGTRLPIPLPESWRL